MKTKVKQLFCKHDYKYEGGMSEQWRLSSDIEVKVICMYYLCTKCSKVKFVNVIEK